MIRLEEKYEQAVQFRKRGFTYSEIAKIVGVSKSTVSNWLAQKAFSKKVKKDNQVRAAKDNVKRIALVNKARSAERNNRYSEAVRSAETEFKHYKKDPLFIAGLTTYISQGDMHDRSRMRLTAGNHFLHATFIQFAFAYLGVHKDQLHFWLLLYANQDEQKCMKFWAKKTKISLGQFYKAQFISQQTKSATLQHGTGNTIICSTVLKMRLVRWIELFTKELS